MWFAEKGEDEVYEGNKNIFALHTRYFSHNTGTIQMFHSEEAFKIHKTENKYVDKNLFIDNNNVILSSSLLWPYGKITLFPFLNAEWWFSISLP